MRDRSKLIDGACAAILSGDVEACDAALERFRDSVARRALSEEEQQACATQLARLRSLASAACEGVESARAWLADLLQATGGLEVYDRSGRQRVPTDLNAKARRF